MSESKQLLHVKREGGKIWSPVRSRWLEETPEERVRQEYLCVLTNEYGYTLEQFSEEAELTGRGSGHARADFVIWRSVKEKTDQKNPLIVIECKSDNVTIQADDYWQGDNYARISGARFVVTHNNRETKYWRVIHEKMPKNLEEIENIPHALSTDKEIQNLISKLKVFKEDEFANLLHDCHNVIRNREKKDPIAAFDEIAKILFVKVTYERRLKLSAQNLFSADFLDQQAKIHSDYIEVMFRETKQEYLEDQIFAGDDRINLHYNTVREIVKLLERYNLSDTSEDIKGIAFERFLGRTFRGEIGQFFTPRTIVEFMVRMIDPQEGEIICDPASGSGGFLIRFFEIVRQQILADADENYRLFRESIDSDESLSEAEKASALRKKYDEIQRTVDPSIEGSKLWNLANRCIYGTDANDRMARTSKMNMIMHGDGHGGVHHHDGFINVNGIFDGRFDVILTNPPFGSNVEETDVVLESQINVSAELEKVYIEKYGQLYVEAQKKVRAVATASEPKDRAIKNLFKLPKSNQKKIKTEILFIERCLNLLKPGGRLGIVLPEGIFNNPSLSYVRMFVEDQAYISAIVSLPPETFFSSGASVKASLLFLRKFTNSEQSLYNSIKADVEEKVKEKYKDEIKQMENDFLNQIAVAKDQGDMTMKKQLQRDLKSYLKNMEETKFQEARLLLKRNFNYPVFLYEAERVGITSTGGPDENELYPNDNAPKDIPTCLDLYRQFKNNDRVSD